MLPFIADVASEPASTARATGSPRTTGRTPARASSTCTGTSWAGPGYRRHDVSPPRTAERVIELDDRVAVELAGEQDRVLRALEDRLELEIALRGNRLTLVGQAARVRAGAEVVEQLAGLVRSGRPIAPGTIDAVADSVEGARGGRAR